MTPTPTQNMQLPLRLGNFHSLSDALDYAAQGETGLNFHDRQGRLSATLAYRQLQQRALQVASYLLECELPPGARVALIAETGPDFLALFYACQYAGLVACPLPYRQAVGTPEAYVAQLRHLLACAQPLWLIAPEHSMAYVRLATSEEHTHTVSYKEVLNNSAPMPPTEAARFHSTAYVQFSSGSTAEPRGVVVTQEALMANATAIAGYGLRMHAQDRAFSWLPLYHDMGLVGFSVVALCGQRSVDYLAPTSFAARPLLWLRLMSRYRTSIVYAPMFAWHLAAQRYAGEGDIDLSSLRIAGVGGDMVHADALEQCMSLLAPAGLREETLQPSYGMAEATLAICMTDAAKEPSIERVALDVSGEVTRVVDAGDRPSPATCRWVGSGVVLPGLEIDVRDSQARSLPDRHIGRLWVRGPSIMRHYLVDSDQDIRDAHGFFDTGDLGYLHAGELFITGRVKDMVLVRGRNIWLRDIESIAERISPLCRGDVAAIAMDEVDGMPLLFVQRALPTSDDRQDLRTRLHDGLLDALGLTIRVEFVPPRSFPFTSSGKLARGDLRRRYMEGKLSLQPTIEMAAHDQETIT